MKPLIPNPEDILPMDQREFFDAYKLASAVATGEIPDQIKNPRDHKFLSGGRTMSLADVPFMRFGLSIAQIFGDREDVYRSFTWRSFALEQVLDDPALSAYVRENNGREIHHSLFYAAAVQPLNATLQFDPLSLAESARAIAEETEEDE